MGSLARFLRDNLTMYRFDNAASVVLCTIGEVKILRNSALPYCAAMLGSLRTGIAFTYLPGRVYGEG